MLVGVSWTYSCEALQEHESETDGHAVPYALLEEFLELRFLAHTVGTAFLDLCSDLAHLMLDVCMRRVKVTKLCQDPFSSIEVVTSGQPTWALLATVTYAGRPTLTYVGTRGTRKHPKEARDQE
jgi:hypothetical protein